MEVKGLSLPKICVPSGGLVFVFWFGYVTVFVFLWSIVSRILNGLYCLYSPSQAIKVLGDTS